ncbi:MAG: BREX protein BrxB domain-containing protein [Bacillota bacterium]
MSSLQARIRCLEEHLLARKPLSGYHDLPFAILRYEPGEELQLRREVPLLGRRLEEAGRRVTVISLTQVMWECLEIHDDLESLFSSEGLAGVDRVVEAVNSLMERGETFVQAIAGRLRGLDPQKDIAFLVDTGGLFPFFRSSAILNRLHGKVAIPTILFYPGRLEGAVGLSFLGVFPPDPTYRPNILCEV